MKLQQRTIHAFLMVVLLSYGISLGRISLSGVVDLRPRICVSSAISSCARRALRAASLGKFLTYRARDLFCAQWLWRRELVELGMAVQLLRPSRPDCSPSRGRPQRGVFPTRDLIFAAGEYWPLSDALWSADGLRSQDAGFCLNSTLKHRDNHDCRQCACQSPLPPVATGARSDRKFASTRSSSPVRGSTEAYFASAASSMWSRASSSVLARLLFVR